MQQSHIRPALPGEEFRIEGIIPFAAAARSVRRTGIRHHDLVTQGRELARHPGRMRASLEHDPPRRLRTLGLFYRRDPIRWLPSTQNSQYETWPTSGLLGLEPVNGQHPWRISLSITPRPAGGRPFSFQLCGEAVIMTPNGNIV